MSIMDRRMTKSLVRWVTAMVALFVVGLAAGPARAQSSSKKRFVRAQWKRIQVQRRRLIKKWVQAQNDLQKAQWNVFYLRAEYEYRRRHGAGGGQAARPPARPTGASRHPTGIGAFTQTGMTRVSMSIEPPLIAAVPGPTHPVVATAIRFNSNGRRPETVTRRVPNVTPGRLWAWIEVRFAPGVSGGVFGVKLALTRGRTAMRAWPEKKFRITGRSLYVPIKVGSFGVPAGRYDLWVRVFIGNRNSYQHEIVTIYPTRVQPQGQQLGPGHLGAP
ncbi:MAG: hypothetical protein J7M25_05420 [Deltaproteobacteria bacterium]|nr:hypothetical protein [Deltaproteobacteria bacterium]